MIQVTDKAAARIHQILAKETGAPSGSGGLRLAVQGGGQTKGFPVQSAGLRLKSAKARGVSRRHKAQRGAELRAAIKDRNSAES